MKRLLTKGKIAVFIITAILLIDQTVKVWVKTHMFRGESIKIADWFYIYFTENNGMAFGMEIFSKMFLTSFRIVAVGFIVWFLYKAIRKALPTGFIICMSLILSGALGNIIDSVFYGLIFSESNVYGDVATFVPFGEGYATWFHGKVVDMLYFPLIETNWPTWVPFVGGEHFIFFSPIFNIADAAISCGIVAIVLFYGKYLSREESGLQKTIEKEETSYSE